MNPADDEEWVKSAMKNDTLVVELLVQLHHKSPRPVKPAILQFDWTVRQRRSKSVTFNKNSKNSAHRASPTTPLSWSSATTASVGSGFEESSLKVSGRMRSKIINGISDKTPCKKSRKKKTLAQLKEEENFLVKERRELNKQIAALQMNLGTQKAENESLRRMKREMQPEEPVSLSSIVPPIVSQSSVSHKQSINATSDPPKFVLPDLNMPFFEDSVF